MPPKSESVSSQVTFAQFPFTVLMSSNNDNSSGITLQPVRLLLILQLEKMERRQVGLGSRFAFLLLR